MSENRVNSNSRREGGLASPRRAQSLEDGAQSVPPTLTKRFLEDLDGSSRSDSYSGDSPTTISSETSSSETSSSETSAYTNESGSFVSSAFENSPQMGSTAQEIPNKSLSSGFTLDPLVGSGSTEIKGGATISPPQSPTCKSPLSPVRLLNMMGTPESVFAQNDSAHPSVPSVFATEQDGRSSTTISLSYTGLPTGLSSVTSTSSSALHPKAEDASLLCFQQVSSAANSTVRAVRAVVPSYVMGNQYIIKDYSGVFKALGQDVMERLKSESIIDYFIDESNATAGKCVLKTFDKTVIENYSKEVQTYLLLWMHESKKQIKLETPLVSGGADKSTLDAKKEEFRSVLSSYLTGKGKECSNYQPVLQKITEKVEDAAVVDLVCRITPEITDPKKLLIVAQYIIALFVFDDITEGKVGGEFEEKQVQAYNDAFNNVCLSLVRGTTEELDGKYADLESKRQALDPKLEMAELFFWDAMKGLANSTASQSSKDTVRETTSDYIGGTLKERELLKKINSNLDPVNISEQLKQAWYEDYKKIRLDSGAVRPCYAIVNALSSSSNEPKHLNSRLTDIEDIVNRMVCWVNDLASLTKESFDNEQVKSQTSLGESDAIMNLVFLRMRLFNESKDQAINKIVQEYDKEIESLYIQLESDDLDRDGLFQEVRREIYRKVLPWTDSPTWAANAPRYYTFGLA
jgi:hypothetical protein